MSERTIVQKNQPLQPATNRAGGILQRKCACGNHTHAGGECAECGKKKGMLQRKLTIGASNDPLEQEADRIADQVLTAPGHLNVIYAPPRILRFAVQPATGQAEAPASVDEALASPGRPLEPPLRQDMEQRFGYDFSRVRVHSGAAAEQSARDVSALAYTVGQNIVFSGGQFDQGTNEGRRLIAHELAHVVQQSGSDGIRADQGNEKHGLSSISTISPITISARGETMVQRACGPEIGSVGGCIGRGGDLASFGESSYSVYLFNRNCDVFADHERKRLEEYSDTIAFDAHVDIDGFASEEGEPTFNENLSCARAQRAQEVISAVTGVHTTAYKHGATPGDRQTHRSAVITVRTAESEPEQGGGEAPVPTEPVTPAAPAVPAPPEDCAPAGARETASDCTPNPQGDHLPPVGGTHTEAHALQPCLLTEAQVAASSDWCIDRTQGHGGEVCYRQIPNAEGDPGDQYCYSLNCCHNSRDLVSTVDPASTGSGTCCDNAGWWTRYIEHVGEDVVPEILHDPVRVFRDLTGL